MREKIVWRWFLTAAALVSLLLCCVFVWPTRFRDEQVRLEGTVGVLRTNRLSGESRLYIAYPHGPRNEDGSLTLGRQK